MRRNDTRLGIFGFLLITLAVLAAVVMFARYPAIFRTGRDYRAVFASVAGLNPGDEVRYGGLLVGSVTDLALAADDPTRIVVHFRVKRNTPMRLDTEASISQVGLLGTPYLALRPGSPRSPALAEGGTVPSTDSPTFQDAVGRLASFLDRVDTLLTGAERVAQTSPIERLDRTLSRIDSVVTVASALMTTANASGTRVFGRLDTASARLTTLLDRSERLIVSIDTVVRTSGPGLAETQREALDAVRELRLVLGDLRDAMNARGGVDQLVRNMSIATENLARISERIEQDPASLFKSRATPRKVAGPPVRR